MNSNDAMKDELHKTDVFKILKGREARTVNESVIMCKAGIPTSQESVKPFLTTNMRYQTELMDLIGRLDYLIRENTRVLDQIYGRNVLSGELEPYYKSTHHQVLMDLDNEYRDRKLKKDTYEVVYNQLSTLKWQLKSLFDKAE